MDVSSGYTVSAAHRPPFVSFRALNRLARLHAAATAASVPYQ
jgi:hypothetical protein